MLIDLIRLRLQGLEAKYYNNRLMKHIFHETPLQTLEPLLTSTNCYLFAKELDSIKPIMSCTQKYNWITPLGSVKIVLYIFDFNISAIVMDDRIYSIAEVQKLAQLSSVSMLPAQTVALLSSIPRRTTQVLDHHAQQLVSSLDHIAKLKKTDE
jgi:ribosomal protein L10